MKNSGKGDVYWYAPKRKRPIAYSTKSASDLIVVLSQEYNTIQEVHDAINYDIEARGVLSKYINLGLGSCIAREMFR